jgi:Domain of unknown function (DUF3943)
MVASSWVAVVLIAAEAAGLAPMDSTEPTPSVPTISRSGRSEEAAIAGGSPRYGRAMYWTLALLSGGTLWYWRNPKGQTDDWDLNFDWHSWRRKLDLQAVRFDTNLFTTNAISHPISGSTYFHAARENGLSFFQSYLSTFVASTVWEFFVEFHELPSLNDMIMTPAGGMVLGESTYRLGRFFSSAPPTLANRAGAWIFTPISSLNNVLDGRRPSRVGASMYHHVYLELGGASSTIEGRPRRDELSLGLGSFIVAHAGYRQPGRSSVVVGPGVWSGLSLRLLTEGSAPQGVAVHGRTLFAGRYAKSYLEPGDGQGLLLGVGGTFDYDVRALDPGWDRVASVGLLGPMTELTVDRPWLHLRLSLSAAYSFAILSSLAWRVYGASVPPEDVQTSLRTEGYYYGHGITGSGALTLRVSLVEVALTADVGLFRSLDGRDRFEEERRADLSLRDTRATFTAMAALRVVGGLSITGRVEKVQRTSRLLDRTVSADETRLGLFSTLLF